MQLFRKIIQFGVPRSGSTLIYNVIKALLPYARVKKVHDLRGVGESLPIVCTYRNPLDVMASLFESQKIELNQASLERQIVLLNLSGIWDAVRVSDQSNTLMLRYENFYCDLAGAVRSVAEFLDVKVTEEKVGRITQKLRLESVVEHTAGLRDFSEVDKKTKFHGNHVSRFRGEPGYHVEVFDSEQIELISRSFYFFMRRFGYC